jgi:hypothetical protein
LDCVAEQNDALVCWSFKTRETDAEVERHTSLDYGVVLSGDVQTVFLASLANAVTQRGGELVRELGVDLFDDPFVDFRQFGSWL